jgi:formamidopyrimidine-DNA glycosylase
MPELPEIETVRLQLSQVLPGKEIEKIEILKPKSFIGKKELAEESEAVIDRSYRRYNTGNTF